MSPARGYKMPESAKRKISAAHKGRSLTEEHKRKISEAHKNKKLTRAHRKAISNSLKGKMPKFIPNRMGIPCKKETKMKISKTLKGRKHTREHAMKIGKAHEGFTYSMESRISISASHQGIDIDEWNGFVSGKKYCIRFNNLVKEKTRNRDGRTCKLCGKNEIQEGKKMSVHHIDGDKMQGCNGRKWHLVSLCSSCHQLKNTPIKEFLIVCSI